MQTHIKFSYYSKSNEFKNALNNKTLKSLGPEGTLKTHLSQVTADGTDLDPPRHVAVQPALEPRTLDTKEDLCITQKALRTIFSLLSNISFYPKERST